jgi:hypothetical protein
MKQENPYKGLFPYTEKDEKLFFGEKETKDLLEMIKNHQFVVLYGESGTGKSSLINAKIFPELRRQYYFPINIRINYISEDAPLKQVRKIIYEGLKEWDNNVEEFTEDLTLIQYAAKTSVYNGLVKPILFFDQFEEFFTLGNKYVDKESLNELIDQLSDLTELKLKKAHATPTNVDDKDRQAVLINNQERVLKESKGLPFGNDIGGGHLREESIEEKILREESIRENILRFTVVFSLRQDFIAQLDDFRFKIPCISTNRYRIKKFDHSQALDAIIKPANELVIASEYKEEPFCIIDKDTAEDVIAQLRMLESSKDKDFYVPKRRLKSIFTKPNVFLSLFTSIINSFKKPDKQGDKAEICHRNFSKDYPERIMIDPTVLSLYCYQLYEEAKALEGNPEEIKKTGHKLSQIRSEQVRNSPCKEIIKRYYLASFNQSKIRRSTRFKIESTLITPDGRRILMPIDEFVDETEIREEELRFLKGEVGIIRIYGEGEESEVEFAHDQIARRALISKKTREANRIVRNASMVMLTILAVVISISVHFLYSLSREKHSLERERQKVSVKSLQSEVKALKQINNELAESVAKLKDENSGLLADIQSLETDRYELRVRVVGLENDRSRLIEQTATLEMNSYDLQKYYNFQKAKEQHEVLQQQERNVTGIK